MLLLTQGGEIVNLDRMAIVDTTALQVYARHGIGERGIILGGYSSEERCKAIIADIFFCHKSNANTYIMPRYK